MKKTEIEKILKHKLQPGKSLREQSTPEQWQEICYWSEVETIIISEQGKPGKTLSNAEIKKQLKAKYRKILDDAGGDYTKAAESFE